MSSYLLIGPNKTTNEIKFDHDYTIFIDGGLDFKPHHFTQDHTSIGDGDSTTKDLLNVLNPIKDKSDLAHAIKLIGKDCKEVHCYGLIDGPRIDHLFFNIGEVYHYLISKLDFTFIFYDQLGEVSLKIFSQKQTNFKHNGIFSLGSLKNQTIEISGDCKYQGEYELEILSSQGLSNIGYGQVKIKHIFPLIVFYTN